MEFKNNHSIYLQIADHFFENILERKWKSGEKVPSIRDSAIDYEVNPNTSMRTYTYLQEKGIIYNKRGLGYFIAEDGYERTLALKKQQFLKHDLPVFFKTMNLLGVTIEELIQYYKPNEHTHENKL